MTSLTYSKIELLICLHFPMVATGLSNEGVSLYVAVRYFEEILFDLKEMKKGGELIKHLRSDAPIWNLADIPITDNESEISADTDSRSDIQHNFLQIFLPFST